MMDVVIGGQLTDRSGPRLLFRLLQQQQNNAPPLNGIVPLRPHRLLSLSAGPFPFRLFLGAILSYTVSPSFKRGKA